MSAFITNFQSPVELDDLIDRYRFDGRTNIDILLEDSDKDRFTEWTVPKDAQVGDIALFMCAKSSKDHMGHVLKLAKMDGDPGLIAFAERQRDTYKKYAGNILAIGFVDEEPYQLIDSGYRYQYWRSPWYAKIRDIRILSNMVNISEYRDFIKISRTGAITKLSYQQWSQLKDLIELKNT